MQIDHSRQKESYENILNKMQSEISALTHKVQEQENVQNLKQQ